MHGRVKVRTTAEQEAIKNAERAKKVKEYRAVMSVLITKRKEKNWDEEYLVVISKMLLKNADMTTLWNMRREVLETMDQESKDYLEQLNYELTLTEQCLKENPKSYCVWHHRCWVIEHLPEPNWKKELDLCALCLDKDERNFHCWDYRNFLVNKANVSDEEEFQFSTSKILKNFSNYSSWHYRSKLLSKMFPDDKNTLPIREDKHKEELDLVMDATFTDPYDSSAWFYQRWLLESRTSHAATLCRVHLDKHSASIAFHKEIEIDSPKVFFCVNDAEVKCDWTSRNGKRFSKFFLAEFAKPLENLANAKITLKFNGNEFPLSKQDSNELWLYQGMPIVSDGYNETQLREQLKNYKQLSELEPENKWSILTGIFLMKNVHFVEFYENILQDLTTLIKIDSLRLNYYKDLRSKYVLEYNLIWKTDAINQSSANLSGMDLTTIYYEQYFSAFEEVNLSDNQISRSLHLLYSLQNCTNLSLANNGIESLNSMPKLRKLKMLYLQNNNIRDVDEITALVKKLEKLEEIDLRNNPVSQTDVVERVREFSSDVKVIVE